MALVIMGIITGLLARVNALKVQDRTIRVEEQLRYFMLFGSPIDLDYNVTTNRLTFRIR